MIRGRVAAPPRVPRGYSAAPRIVAGGEFVGDLADRERLRVREQARIKTLLKRFDLDGSGELETDEFRDCALAERNRSPSLRQGSTAFKTTSPAYADAANAMEHRTSSRRVGSARPAGLEDFLHGLSDAEFDALAQRFDADGSGSVSVAEFTDALQKLARQREDAPAADRGGTRASPWRCACS